jgi:hypothetical protein
MERASSPIALKPAALERWQPISIFPIIKKEPTGIVN